ncbi:MAG: chemotaxis protein CheC [Gallionellales bacterium RIFCSPLOWO2_12_FULL_59_22]|nr:MAG: chemotaxis protein CheC [Gallionellales bacterium RIFCSPLOWO2_02_FULL_59_110]OGT01210.1 MAG: chemotaxis protein CheC [Gallionellales bacterium RIFCSPLOWO2_02_58_13]OGT13365.1 MAG: chemotaxis protein CheC [Gallionellales bacterium RIFCSPLOWO2_12_FULL_59_22]
MNPLSELQLDALTEIFNIGAGRAASSLSEIVGDEVKLSVPCVQLYQSTEINADILSLNSSRLGAVKQSFNGPFHADAMLLFTEDRALEIVHDIMNSQVGVEDVAEFEQEAMCELGNIILNACLSSMADMLDVTLNSSLPVYSVGTAEVVLRQIVSESPSLMLVLHIDLNIEKRHLQGYLVFLLSSSSLQKLLAHIDRFIAGI